MKRIRPWIIAAAGLVVLVVVGAFVLWPGAATPLDPDQGGATQPMKHPEAGPYIRDSAAWKRLVIVSGGQAGVDRAALDVALELKLPVRGWCQKNRLAEDGRIPERYPLQESSSEDPALRTELNAFDSDGTLVLSKGLPKDGTPLTEEVAKLHKKPFHYIDLDAPLTGATVTEFHRWVEENHIRILNIGGPRESHQPGFIYTRSKEIVDRLLRKESKVDR